MAGSTGRAKDLPLKKSLLVSAIASVATAHFSPAGAQVAAANAGPPTVAEIVVTAQKRKEDLKNVPLSITVLKGSALEQQKVVDYQDLARIVPGLSVTNTGGSSLSRLSIRGISSEQGSATVGVYLGDISLTVPNLFLTGESLPTLFDMSQVEVLRGPQGTLFGASSLGGAIRFIPNEPNLTKVEGEIRGDLSGTHLAGTDYLTEGVLNVPIVEDKIAVRVGIQRSDQTGFVTRYDLPMGTTGTPPAGTPSKKVGDEQTTAVRASLLFKPDATLSIEPAVLWQNSYDNGTSIYDLSYLPDFAQNRTTPEHIIDDLFVGSFTVRKEFHDFQLTSITGYVRRDNDRLLDGQAYDSDYVAYNLDPSFGSTYNTIAGLKAPYRNDVISDQLSQEVRLSSKSIKETGSRFEWQLGGYYSNQSVKSLDDEVVSGLGQALTNIYGEDPSVVLGAPLVNDEVGAYHYTSRTVETAIFGQASYVILPKLTATVGARQSWADSSYFINESGYFNIGLPATYERSHSEKPIIPKFSLSYDLNREATFYTTVAKGYRLGGENIPLPSSCGSAFAAYGISNFQGSYGSDSLWSYEGGAKLRLFQDRLSINTAGYYIDWSNIQQNLNLAQCGYSVVVNAGSARSDGGELEVIGRLTRSLSLSFTGAVTDANITRAAPGSGASDGQSVLFVPRDSFSVGADFEHPILDDLRAHGHIDVNYTGASHGTFLVTDPDYERPSYTVVNLNAGVSHGPLDIYFFAKNIFDESKTIQTPSVLFIEEGVRVRPRSLGISATYKF